MEEWHPDFQISIGLFGDKQVGKTRLFKNLCDELEAAAQILRTQDCSIATLKLELEGRRILIKLKDFAENKLNSFIRGQRTGINPFDVDIFCITCSLRQQHSFTSLGDWFDAICSYGHREARGQCLVVATHADAGELKGNIVPVDKVTEWAYERGCAFASTGYRLHEDFPIALEEVIRRSIPLSSHPIVRRSICLKQGGWVRSWKARLFVLEDSGILKYYQKSERFKNIKGQVHLGAAKRVLAGADCDVSWPAGVSASCAFGVELPQRTYYIVAEDEFTAQGWIKDLRKFITQ
eukprot:TRINITY_DN12415_c0_g1_i1.p1 TRINITY_DN12415_c0_g1~~TRINITY_DN12415_c0_g1_i1.p1  ORF type:complete len:293 (+),score=51.17 TRINITY_DN12415_c0_g1_i1:124-1002(+)